MSDAVPYEQLDPGIRKVVRWLNENGFETTDSGDGRSKFLGEDPPCCAMNFPNVAITVPRDRLVAEALRLEDLLRSKGCGPVAAREEETPGEVTLQAFYEPVEAGGGRSESGYILLCGLDDQVLGT